MATSRVQELLARVEAEGADPGTPIDFFTAIEDFSEAELLELSGRLAERSGIIPENSSGDKKSPLRRDIYPADLRGI